MDMINCKAAKLFCYAAINAPFIEAGYNPYDLTKLWYVMIL